MDVEWIWFEYLIFFFPFWILTPHPNKKDFWSTLECNIVSIKCKMCKGVLCVCVCMYVRFCVDMSMCVCLLVLVLTWCILSNVRSWQSVWRIVIAICWCRDWLGPALIAQSWASRSCRWYTKWSWSTKIRFKLHRGRETTHQIYSYTELKAAEQCDPWRSFYC